MNSIYRLARRLQCFHITIKTLQQADFNIVFCSHVKHKEAILIANNSTLYAIIS